MSKNNFQERLRKMEPKKDHYSIRKFSIGAASVLIGISFLGLGKSQTVKAETIASQPKPVVESSAVKKPAVTASKQLGADKAATIKTAADTSIKTKKANSEISQSQASSNKKIEQPAEKALVVKTAAEKASAKKQEIAKGEKTPSAKAKSVGVNNKSATKDKTADAAKSNTLNVSKLLGKDKENTNKIDQSKLKKMLGSSLQEETPTKVHDAAGLTNAINDASVHEIQLTSDINLDDQSFNSRNIARQITIDGNSNDSNSHYRLNFGNINLSFTNQTVGDQGWDITLKNLIINAGANNNSPIDYSHLSNNNQKKSSITFENVTAKLTGRSLTNSEEQVNFKGTNTINESNLQRGENVVEANAVDFLAGSQTRFNAEGDISGTLNSSSPNGDVIRATSNGSKAVNIAAGATVEITSASPDIRGIVAGHIAPLSPSKQEGEVYVAGTLNESLDKGHSSAIWAGNLTIDSGQVSIQTKQDNQADGVENSWVNGVTNYNGYHYAPISLGSNGNGTTSNTDSSLNIDQRGSLKLVRQVENETRTLTPLIAFGDGGSQDTSKQSLYVGKGSTLDLQDNAASFAASVTNSNTPKQGLITMFGTGSTDTVVFDNPEFINLQRTGSTVGTLLRIEGKKSSNSNNMQIVVKGTTPIAEWDQGNFQTGPSFLWHVKKLQTQNGWGDYADKFVKSRHNVNDFLFSNRRDTTESFMQSNGSVELADDEANKLNQFQNNFNWWTEQRIAIGSKLDSDSTLKDHAQYQGTTIKQGQTGTVSAPLINNTPADASDVSSYASGEGIQSWATVNDDGTISLAPTTSNSAANTMYNVPVLITYKNNTSETVFAPVYVTNDDNHHVTWGKDPTGKATGAVVLVTDPSKLKAHETSGNDHDQILDPSSAVSSIEQYKINEDGKAVPNGAIDKSQTIISWAENGSPSTHVESASMSESISGTIKVDLSNITEIDSVLGSTSVSAPISGMIAEGALAKNGASISIATGDQPTSDQLKQLVDHSNLDKLPDDMQVDHYGLKDALDTSVVTTTNKDVTVRIFFKDKGSDGQDTYLDVKVPGAIKVVNHLSDADKYSTSYEGKTAHPGGRVDNWLPAEITDADGNKLPSNVTATFAGDDLPDWVSSVDSNNGLITINSAPAVGYYNIPIKITYSDGSIEKTYAPLAVTDNGGQVIWNGSSSSATYWSSVNNYHKTNDGSGNDPEIDSDIPTVVKIAWTNYETSDHKPQTIVYERQSDGSYKLIQGNGNNKDDNGETAPTIIAAGQINGAWEPGFEGNSDASKFGSTATSWAKDQWNNPHGDQQDETGNSRARMVASLRPDAQRIFGTDSVDFNIYSNYYGAKATDAVPEFKQNQDISNLSQAQYRQLVDVTDLGRSGWNGININPNAPEVLAYLPGNDNNKKFWMSWAPGKQPSTSSIGNNIGGTVRIHFSDGTWLDIPVDIKVKADKDSGKPDHDKSEFTQKIVYIDDSTGQEVAYTTIDDIPKGSTLSADSLKSTIDSNVPTNYAIKTGYVYPDAIVNIQATPAIIYVPLTHNSDDHFNAHGKIVYQLSDGTPVADGASISSHIGDTLTAGLLKDLADEGMTTNTRLKGYVIAKYPASYDVTSDDFTIVVIVKAGTEVIKPTDPQDPNQQDLFENITRTINVHNPDGTVDVTKQVVHFDRTKTINLVTGKVVSYGDWQLMAGSAKDWPEFTAPAIAGYTADPAIIAEELVTPETEDTTVDIYYQEINNGGSNNQNPGNGDNSGNHNNGDNHHDQDNGEQNSHQHQNSGENNHQNGSHQTSNGGHVAEGEFVTRRSHSLNSQKEILTSSASSKSASAKRLPQTGESNSQAGLVGLGLAAVAGLFGLAGDRKRKHNR